VFQALNPRMIISGIVRVKKPFGLLIELQEVMDEFGRHINDKSLKEIQYFKLTGLLHTSELGDLPSSDASTTLLDRYLIGDCVKAIIISVDPVGERLSLSFKKSRCTSNLSFSPGLSSVQNEEYNEKTEQRSNFNEKLTSAKAFDNPCSVDSMKIAFGIEENDTLMRVDVYDREQYWDRLRSLQSKFWAKETVAVGISYAKSGDYTKAMQCYKQALDVDPDHIDAFVARGAAFANVGLLEDAIQQFERALKVDPHDKNALKYLDATKRKVK